MIEIMKIYWYVPVIEANPLFTPVDYDYFKDGKTYIIRLFCASGKRYEIKLKAQIVGKIDFSTETLIKVPAKPEKGFKLSILLVYTRWYK